MRCPSCGRYIFKESTSCQYCGHQFGKESGNGKRKKRRITRRHIAAFFVVILLGIFLFYFLQHETETADRLVRAAQKEVEKGVEILQEVERELYTLREIQFENVDNINSERDYALQSREKVQLLMPRLDEASVFFERAEAFCEKVEELSLPGWYRQYINVETEIVKTYAEYCTALKTISTNLIVYYEFSEHYLLGEQLLANLMDDMDRGNDNLERGEYGFAVAAFETALEQIRKAQEEFAAASKMIDLQYMTDFLSNVICMERALYNLSEAARQLELGNVDQANLLASLGTKELESLNPVNKVQLKTQISQWYAGYITEEFHRIEQLKYQGAELENEAEALRK